MPPEVVYLVEQRIGRLDRIGQIYDTVRIHNFYYDGTVEAKVYKKCAIASMLLREQAVMSAEPEEEGVLLGKFDQILDPVASGLALD